MISKLILYRYLFFALGWVCVVINWTIFTTPGTLSNMINGGTGLICLISFIVLDYINDRKVKQK